MNWFKKCKLPAIEVLKNNGQLCIEIDNLWQALYQIFNSAQNWQVNMNILDEILLKPSLYWPPFSNEGFISTIYKCNNSSIFGPDRVSWKYFKAVIKDIECLKNIVNIANTCINLGHWPLHFKMSLSIIIPKPNKVSYEFPKSFHPIILLNTLEKLIEKVISERLQFQSISKNFIHLNQLGGLKQYLTIGVDVFLIYLIHSDWVKNLFTNTLAFDIA